MAFKGGLMEGQLTLKEFAEKRNIKKPTVNARLKRLERNNPDKTLTVKKENVIYLTNKGLELLNKSFNEIPVKTPPAKRKVEKRVNKPVKENEIIKLYEKQIERLENDLKLSRLENERLIKQNDKLMALITDLTGSLSGALLDSQRLLNQEQSLALIDKTGAGENKKEKKSLIVRLALIGRIIKGNY